MYRQLSDMAIVVPCMDVQMLHCQLIDYIVDVHDTFALRFRWHMTLSKLYLNCEVKGKYFFFHISIKNCCSIWFNYGISHTLTLLPRARTLTTLQTLVFGSSKAGTINCDAWIWITHQLYNIIFTCHFTAKLIWKLNYCDMMVTFHINFVCVSVCVHSPH